MHRHNSLSSTLQIHLSTQSSQCKIDRALTRLFTCAQGEPKAYDDDCPARLGPSLCHERDTYAKETTNHGSPFFFNDTLLHTFLQIAIPVSL